MPDSRGTSSWSSCSAETTGHSSPLAPSQEVAGSSPVGRLGLVRTHAGLDRGISPTGKVRTGLCGTGRWRLVGLGIRSAAAAIAATTLARCLGEQPAAMNSRSAATTAVASVPAACSTPWSVIDSESSPSAKEAASDLSAPGGSRKRVRAGKRNRPSDDSLEELAIEALHRGHHEGPVEIVVVLLAGRLGDEQAAVAGRPVERLVVVLDGAVIGADGVARAEGAVFEVGTPGMPRQVSPWHPRTTIRPPVSMWLHLGLSWPCGQQPFSHGRVRRSCRLLPAWPSRRHQPASRPRLRP